MNILKQQCTVRGAVYVGYYVLCWMYWWNRSKKHVCLVDLTGQDRELPGLNRQKQKQLPVIAENIELDEILPWKVGFSETSGIRNKYAAAV